MTVRFDAGVLGAVLLSAGVACAALHAAEWKPAELVTFTDFDNLEVKLDGMKHKAFLVGLRPISENGQGMARQQVTRKAVEEELKKSELFAQVVTRRGEVLGLSIDAFAHHKHGFEHAWNPSKYPYCWSG